MTAVLVPVWSPADFVATVAAAAEHSVMLVSAPAVEVSPSPRWKVPAERGRRYRGEHRANRFRRTVTDVEGDL